MSNPAALCFCFPAQCEKQSAFMIFQAIFQTSRIFVVKKKHVFCWKNDSHRLFPPPFSNPPSPESVKVKVTEVLGIPDGLRGISEPARLVLASPANRDMGISEVSRFNENGLNLPSLKLTVRWLENPPNFDGIYKET